MPKNDAHSHPVDPAAFMQVTDEIREYLKFLASMGCTGVPAEQQTLDILWKWDAQKWAPVETIDAISQDIAKCRKCRLAREDLPALVGAGDVDARLMFVGGFPDAAEQAAGVPYAGKAGELLSKIISAIHLSSESVYICHVVKCCPRDGTLPDRFVARACRTFLDRQIDLIQPEMICVLGEFAAQILLKTDTEISRLRGRFHKYRGIRVMPTHDPAFLLKNPSVKRAVWEDMKQVMQACGLGET